MVLLMTVNPGYGGQKMIPYTIDKIRELRGIVQRRGLSTDIEVDGGVKLENVDQFLNHLFMLVQLKVVCIMVVHYMNLVNMIMVVVDQFVIIIMELVGEVFLMMKGFIALVMLLFVTY